MKRSRRRVAWPALWFDAAGASGRGVICDIAPDQLFLRPSSLASHAGTFKVGARIRLSFLAGGSHGDSHDVMVRPTPNLTRWDSKTLWGTIEWCGQHQTHGQGVEVRLDTPVSVDLSDSGAAEPAATSEQAPGVRRVPRLIPWLAAHRRRLYVAAGVLLVAGSGFGAVVFLPDKDEDQATASAPPVVPQPSASAVPPVSAEPPPDPVTTRVAAYLQEGHRLLQIHYLKRALAEYRKAQALAPRDEQVLRSLGVAYTMLGDPENAVQAYRAYLDLFPQTEEAAAIRQIVAEYERSGAP